MMQSPVADLCAFLDASPTAWHAVDVLAARLISAGALELSEHDEWSLEPGALYFIRRGGCTLAAFRTGLLPPHEAGFAVAGAHVDSPALKLRFSKQLLAKGMKRLPVEVYGGPILSTWLDRPLRLAGRLTLRSGVRLEHRLFTSSKPIGVIPNLAIHLNREINKGFEYNVHTHLPVLVAAGRPEASSEGTSDWLAGLLEQEAGIDVSKLVSCDLMFVESGQAMHFGEGGSDAVLVNAARLDDLAGCHAILTALMDTPASLHGQVACFMDAEEIGSRTPRGADSSFMRDVFARICLVSGCGSEGFYRAMARSFFLSVDVAQAWHPAYTEKYDDSFSPLLGSGVAIKSNALFKYATDSETEAAVRLYCEEAAIPCQKYMARADMTPGSTIGPMTSALTGMRTADIGHPLLAMHSIRETIADRDHLSMCSLLAAHYRSKIQLP